MKEKHAKIITYIMKTTSMSIIMNMRLSRSQTKQLSLYCRTSPYIIGMVLQYMGNGLVNILFILTVILSGYHNDGRC